MFNLYTSPMEYIKSNVKRLESRHSLYKKLFLFFNVVAFSMALFSSVLTALMISKLIYSSYPDWFFYATAGASAVGALMASLLNFFVINSNISDFKEKINGIEGELVLYNNKVTKRYKGKHREFNLYLKVGVILGSKAAKEEASND